jgi:hypothetical protein
MPFEMLFDGDHKVLLVRFGRALTRQALEAMVEAARDFAAVHGNCDGIVDFSAVEKLDIDVAYLRAYGGSPRVMAGARRILVAPHDEMFGVARLYGLHQSTSQGEEPMVVRDLQEAYDLLGLKDPDFQPLEITDRSPE